MLLERQGRDLVQIASSLLVESGSVSRAAPGEGEGAGVGEGDASVTPGADPMEVEADQSGRVDQGDIDVDMASELVSTAESEGTATATRAPDRVSASTAPSTVAVAGAVVADPVEAMQQAIKARLQQLREVDLRDLRQLGDVVYEKVCVCVKCALAFDPDS